MKVAARAFSARQWIAVAACATLALWVHHLALGRFFSPDDLVLLERVRGVAPPLPSLWRWLSGTAYFGAVAPWFGSNPFPYLLVNGLLHASNVALVYCVVRRRGGSALAGIAAAGLFGASRHGFALLGQAVGVGDLLALALTLAACLLVTSRAATARALGVVTFAGALLAKESVAILPLAWLVVPSEDETAAERARRWRLLLLVAALWTGYLLATHVRETMLGGPAYRTGFGLSLLGRLLSYAEWSVDLWTPTPDYVGRPLGVPWLAGGVVLAAWMAIAVGSWRQTRLPAFGLVWWLFAIVPVLPLIEQRNAYYLYPAWVGVSVAIGGLLDATRKPAPAPRQAARSRVTPRTPREILRWGVAGFAVVAHATISEALLERRVGEKLPGVDLPRDALIRKQEVIRRASTRVGAAYGDRTVRLVFYNPQVRGASDFYTSLVPAALDQGRGLRALHPNVDSVAFVKQWSQDYADFEVVVGSEDGNVVPLGKGPEAHQRLLSALLREGFTDEALRHATAAVAAYPEDPGLALGYATALLAHRDTADAVSALSRIEAHGPAPFAARARVMLESLAGEPRR
jgi:hypothetical protein